MPGQEVREFSAAADWPRQSFLELAALPSAVPCARLHAREVLWEWRQGSQAEEAELLVSELVTNAVQASALAAGRLADLMRAACRPCGSGWPATASGY